MHRTGPGPLTGLSTPTPDLLDLTHESVIVMGLDGLVEEWNAASIALYGWSRAGACGRKATELLQCRFSQPRMEIDAALGASDRWQGEVGRTTANGVEVVIDVCWTMQRNRQGQAVRIVESGRDVTAHILKDEGLGLSEHRYRSMYQAMAASFWELDITDVAHRLRALDASQIPDFEAFLAEQPRFVDDALKGSRFSDVNDKTVQLLGGTTKGDVLGKPITVVWPDAAQNGFARALVAAWHGQTEVTFETRLQALDGRALDVVMTICWPEELRRAGAALVGVVDITDRKLAEADLRQSEHRYRTMFGAMSVSFWRMDFKPLNRVLGKLVASGVTDILDYARRNPAFVDQALALSQVIDVNEKTVQLFGAKSREDLLGSAAPFWPKQSHGAFMGSIDAGIRGRRSYEAETQLLTLDGRLIDVVFTAGLPRDRTETANVLLGVIDISERVAARASLQRMQATLAHAARVSTLGELTASIAHEVNQPLAAIATNGAAALRWLNRPAPDLDEARLLTSRIIGDARRAAEIIARIRAMATPGATERAELAINDCIGETAALLGHEIQAQRATLHLDLAPGLPMIAGDRIQVQQVLVNLAINALQAMAHAGGSINELVMSSRAAGGFVAITVEDSGPGIDGVSLFESFFTTKPDGMGLGLSICRSIVESHGGAIHADGTSRLGGACFTVTLPA